MLFPLWHDKNVFQEKLSPAISKTVMTVSEWVKTPLEGSLFLRTPGLSPWLSSSLMQVLIRRRPLLYVVGLLIPSIFLMLVDVISFYLPLDSGVRIAFKISILLGYTVFRVNMTDELPATAVRTPLIGGISEHSLLVYFRWHWLNQCDYCLKIELLWSHDYLSVFFPLLCSISSQVCSLPCAWPCWCSVWSSLYWWWSCCTTVRRRSNRCQCLPACWTSMVQPLTASMRALWPPSKPSTVSIHLEVNYAFKDFLNVPLRGGIRVYLLVFASISKHLQSVG